MEFEIGLFWRYRVTLLICTLAGVAFAVCYLAFGTSSYQAVARVLVQPQPTAHNTEAARRVDPEFLPTHAETIRSPALIAEVLKSVSVTRPAAMEPEQFDPVRHVLSSLTVTPVLKANVLTIAYRSSDAEEAIKLIEGLVAAHSQRIAQIDGESAQRSLRIVELAEESLRTQRDRLNTQYDELRRQSPMLGKGREADAQLLTRLRTLGEELATAKAERTIIEAKLAAVEGDPPRYELPEPSTRVGSENPSAEAIHVNEIVNAFTKLIDEDEAAALQILTERLSDTQIAYNKLAVAYGEKHPQMIAAKSELDTCEKLIRERADSFRNGWRQQLRLIKEAENSIAAEIADEEREVKETEIYLVQEQHLLNEIGKLERLHESALQQVFDLRAQQKRVENGFHSTQVMTIDGPTIIDAMTWPKPIQLASTCAALGLCVGASLVLLMSVLRTTSKSPEVVKKAPNPRGERIASYTLNRPVHPATPK